MQPSAKECRVQDSHVFRRTGAQLGRRTWHLRWRRRGRRRRWRIGRRVLSSERDCRDTAAGDVLHDGIVSCVCHIRGVDKHNLLLRTAEQLVELQHLVADPRRRLIVRAIARVGRGQVVIGAVGHEARERHRDAAAFGRRRHPGERIGALKLPAGCRPRVLDQSGVIGHEALIEVADVLDVKLGKVVCSDGGSVAVGERCCVRVGDGVVVSVLLLRQATPSGW